MSTKPTETSIEPAEHLITLDAFLSVPDTEGITGTAYLKRFGGCVKIVAMSEKKYRAAMNRTQKINRKGRVDLDTSELYARVVAAQVVEPDFSNAAFLEKAGCLSALDFVQRKLLPGEVTDIYRAIAELSGIDVDIDDDIEDAKN